MSLTKQDALAITQLGRRLGVDPYSLAGLMELESGIRPNVWGGSGGKYFGLIQFGPGARKEVGLPMRNMTVAEQIPYVEKYFKQRGFTPGKHGVTQMYRTVLVGNPYQSGTDSFGTSSDKAAKRMLPGGDLYQRAKSKLDKALGSPLSQGTAIGGEARSAISPEQLGQVNPVLAEFIKRNLAQGGEFKSEFTPAELAALQTPAEEDTEEEDLAPVENRIAQLEQLLQESLFATGEQERLAELKLNETQAAAAMADIMNKTRQGFNQPIQIV